MRYIPIDISPDDVGVAPRDIAPFIEGFGGITGDGGTVVVLREGARD